MIVKYVLTLKCVSGQLIGSSDIISLGIFFFILILFNTNAMKDNSSLLDATN